MPSRGDALLQLAHLGQQRRLVADGGGHAAEQRRDFRAGLREAEDVVDEEENVLVLGVAEVLGDGERGQADALAGAWRLGHLSVDQCGARLRHVLHVDHARLLELEPQVVALAGAFADAAEHRHTAVLHGDVVDQLHDDDGLADAGAAEQADLAALQVGLEQVDDLDAGLEHLELGRLLLQRRRRAVNRPALLRLDRPIREVDRLAEHVQHAPERRRADRHRNRRPGVGRPHARAACRRSASSRPCARGSRPGAAGPRRSRRWRRPPTGRPPRRATRCRSRADGPLELHVHHGTDHLDDLADVLFGSCCAHMLFSMRPPGPIVRTPRPRITPTARPRRSR